LTSLCSSRWIWRRRRRGHSSRGFCRLHCWLLSMLRGPRSQSPNNENKSRIENRNGNSHVNWDGEVYEMQWLREWRKGRIAMVEMEE
jgi:hypothetical protein